MTGKEMRRKAFQVARHIIDVVRDPANSIKDMYYEENEDKLLFGIKISKTGFIEASDSNTYEGGK